jgi:hypothetical protein
MGADDAALLGLDHFEIDELKADQHRYGLDDHYTGSLPEVGAKDVPDVEPVDARVGNWVVTVCEPADEDSPFEEPDQLDEVEFQCQVDAIAFAQTTARRGLKAVLYHGIVEVGVYE